MERRQTKGKERGGGREYMKGEEEQWRESGDAGKMQDLSALQSLVKCSVLTR